MKVILMHEVMAPHDGVGNDIEPMINLLSRQYEVCAYAYDRKNPRLPYVTEEEMLSLIADPGNLIIYHHSVYWPDGEDYLRKAKCPIIFRYHNITPPKFFDPYSENHYYSCMVGQKQTKKLQLEFPKAHWICCSQYNARDLIHLSKEQIHVVPCFAPGRLEDWGNATPDAGVVKKLRDFDGVNILFVGRVVPNKGYHTMLEVLYYYVKQYGPKVKLRVIGKKDENLQAYTDFVETRSKELGVTEQIEFIGEVTDATLSAYYQESDVMLCVSEHEGFCIPVVEAQYFGLPVIALDAGAVPETLGKDQMILSKDPKKIAAAIHVVASSKNQPGGAYENLAAQGHKNYQERYTLEKISEDFLAAFHDCMDHQ